MKARIAEKKQMESRVLNFLTRTPAAMTTEEIASWLGEAFHHVDEAKRALLWSKDITRKHVPGIGYLYWYPHNEDGQAISEILKVSGYKHLSTKDWATAVKFYKMGRDG